MTPRKLKAQTQGCFFLAVIAVVFVAYAVNHLTGIIVGLIGIYLFFRAVWPRTCGLCGNLIERSSHVWRINGKKVRLCPYCNSAQRRGQSRRARACSQYI